MSDDNCLDAASGTSPVKLVGLFFLTISKTQFEWEITALKVRCHGLGGNQAWMRGDDRSIRHR